MESSLTLYLREIGKYPLLTQTEEIELGRRIKEESDGSAREALINSNLRLVVSVAKTFKNQMRSFEDLIADGNTGLITAVDKYDYSLGFRFSTYAVHWIKQAIIKGMSDGTRPIHLPAYVIQQFNEYYKALEEIECPDGSPTMEQIAEHMKISVEDLRKLLQYKQNVISLETPVGEDGDTMADFCADTQTDTPAQYVAKQLRHEKIVNLIHTLNERDQKIFKLRLGIQEVGDPDGYATEHTLEEIGDSLEPKLSRERVRQIISKQCSKWKTALADEVL